MCLKITYLCICGHLNQAVNVHLCSAVKTRGSSNEGDSTSSSTSNEKTAVIGSAVSNGKASMISMAETCSKLKTIQKYDDPYWIMRFCETCIMKLRSARRTLICELKRRDMDEMMSISNQHL
jgi:hypothetical protein